MASSHGGTCCSRTQHTWLVVSLPLRKHFVSYKCTYKIKQNQNNTILHHKVRLIAKGFMQQGVDCIETFSSVAKMNTIKTLLALASHKKWILHQIDVNNAFLHGDLFEEVYMDIPSAYNSQTTYCSSNSKLFANSTSLSMD